MLATTEMIWQEFHDPLRRFILKRVPDEYSAEDILQDVFLKVHTRIETLRDEEKLPSWLYQLTRNAIIDHYRISKPTSEIPEIVYEPEDHLENLARELAPCIQGKIG